LPYRLVRRGRYYEVWQRPATATAPPEDLALGGEYEPSAVPECAEVEALARQARAAGATGLVAARHVPVYGASRGSFSVASPGRYTGWLEGSVRGSVALYVDGEKIGEARQRIEDEGGFIELGTVRLAPGRHEASLRFGGADLHPGSGGFPRPPTGPLLFARAGSESGTLVSVPLSEARSLCGLPWDWIEVAPG
jgi:hypothetical protein